MKVIDSGLLLLSHRSVCMRCFDAWTMFNFCLGIQVSTKPPLSPSLGYSYPSIKPHLSKISLPLSIFNRVSIKNRISSLNLRAIFWHCRTAEGLPKPLQFQLRILMVVKEADVGQLPRTYFQHYTLLVLSAVHPLPMCHQPLLHQFMYLQCDYHW